MMRKESEGKRTRLSQFSRWQENGTLDRKEGKSTMTVKTRRWERIRSGASGRRVRDFSRGEEDLKGP